MCHTLLAAAAPDRWAACRNRAQTGVPSGTGSNWRCELSQIGRRQLAAPVAEPLLGAPDDMTLLTVCNLPPAPAVAIGNLCRRNPQPRRNGATPSSIIADSERADRRRDRSIRLRLTVRSSRCARATPKLDESVPRSRFDQRRRTTDGDAVAPPRPQPSARARGDHRPFPRCRRARRKGRTHLLPARRHRRASNRSAVEETQTAFPGPEHRRPPQRLFPPRGQEEAVCAEIAALKPDILWVVFRRPLEQQFVSAICHAAQASASSRPPADCSTSFQARGRARRAGCRASASNGCSAPCIEPRRLCLALHHDESSRAVSSC